MPGQSLGFHLPLDDHLGCNPGMISARLPQNVLSLHSFLTDQNILKGIVESMPHMEATGNIGWRNDNGIGRLANPLTAAFECAFLFPVFVVFALDLFRPVRLVQHC